MNLLTKAIKEDLAKAYAESADDGGKSADETPIIVKYFNPVGAATWFISEGGPVGDDGEICEVEDAKDWHLFGWADLGMGPGCAELGYVMLSDLKAIKGPLGIGIERDLSYDGHMLSEVIH